MKSVPKEAPAANLAEPFVYKRREDLSDAAGTDPASRDRFEDLYRSHHGAVRSVLFRIGVRDELEDAVHDVFLRAYSSWFGFRFEASPRTWILKIAINLAKDRFKKKVFETREIADEEAAPRDPLAARAIEDALASLTLEARGVFVLCVVEGYSMKEAAQILQIPSGTIKSRLFAARQSVKTFLQERGY